MKHIPLKLTLFTLFVLLLVACGNEKGIVIKDVKANLLLPTETGAVYMEVTNNTDSDDTLLSASIAGCGATELHEMIVAEGIMKMQPVEGGKILIPAGETVIFKKGGLHVMCIGKEASFVKGEMVPVQFEFENAGIIQKDAKVFDIRLEE